MHYLSGACWESRAVPKEGSSQKWSIRQNNPRIPKEGDQGSTGCVSADCSHGGSACLRGPDDVDHLDIKRVDSGLREIDFFNENPLKVVRYFSHGL